MPHFSSSGFSQPQMLITTKYHSAYKISSYHIQFKYHRLTSQKKGPPLLIKGVMRDCSNGVSTLNPKGKQTNGKDSYSNSFSVKTSTHWDQGKIADISQTTISNAFSPMKMFKFLLRFRRPGDKPLSKTMMFSLLTPICFARPQWTNCAVVGLRLLISPFLKFCILKTYLLDFPNHIHIFHRSLAVAAHARYEWIYNQCFDYSERLV